jgi:uncharacterized protein (DUF1501 family)
MQTEITLQTRREFLRRTVLGGALSWTLPTFLAKTFAALQAQAEQLTQPQTGRDSTILVVLQLAGGNDGLNTVVPFTNDYYHRSRPRLRLPESSVQRLSSDIGLHPALTAFKDLHDAGRLAIVQGVGYPNPNRSHFRSTEIWQTASDAGRFERYGWLGRYFDNACAGCDPTVGVSIGRQLPQAFTARQPTGVSLDNPQSYRFLAANRPRPGELGLEDSYRKLNAPEAEAEHSAGATVSSISGPLRHSGSVLDFLERTALDAQVSSDTIRRITNRVSNQASYPASQLGNSLKLVAKLIGGGLPTRVFYVSQGGYDTHTNQLGTQERLLRDLGNSVHAFVEDMAVQGNLARVLLMTFSEFGRRLAENANGGTDHGAAAPMFVVGERVKAGLLGQYPSLAPADLFQGDLRFSVDFRCVYAGVLEGWLRTPSEPVLGRKFPALQVV